MTTNPADMTREQFEVVRRGYEPQQVDRHVTALSRELQAARARTSELERAVEELRNLPPAAPEEVPSEPGTPFAGLGARIEKMLGLADEEARDLRSRAAADAEAHRAEVEAAGEKIRAEAERYAEERRSEADAEAARVLEDARRQSDQLRDDTERNAKARREEAEALFERNRATAAQAAADFETTLAHRRDQAEHDYTEQMKANEAQLASVAQRAEQLRLEAEKLRADADRKSKRTIDEAQRRADDIVAEAKATAERIRTESERELSAATQRRDSINSQLTNVRQMLATLTGAALPNPFGDDGPDTEDSAAPAAPAATEAGPATPASNVTPKPSDAAPDGGPADTGDTAEQPVELDATQQIDTTAAEAKAGSAKAGPTR
jgi:cell division septum initiation protein DivIVA